jgi:predicted RNA methylase
MDDLIKRMLDETYSTYEGSEVMMGYAERHGVESAGILTVYEDEQAAMITEYLEPRIKGKTVVEIGGGIGLLALHMGTVAQRVYCIEANPVWSSCFVAALLRNKPRNVSYLFGTADEFLGQVKGDVAVICSHSGLEAMKLVAAQFAPVVIDVYGELIEAAPEKFDGLAQALRKVA